MPTHMLHFFGLTLCNTHMLHLFGLTLCNTTHLVQHPHQRHAIFVAVEEGQERGPRAVYLPLLSNELGRVSEQVLGCQLGRCVKAKSEALIGTNADLLCLSISGPNWVELSLHATVG